MLKYMKAVCQLGYEEDPDYRGMKALLKHGLSKSGQKDEWKIDFPTQSKAQKRKSTDKASSPLVSPKQRKSATPKKVAAPPKASPKKVAAPSKASPKKATVSPKAAKKKVTPAKTQAGSSHVKGKKVVKASSSPRKTGSAKKDVTGTSSKSTRRRVRKKDVILNDAAIQTTPGLGRNR